MKELLLARVRFCLPSVGFGFKLEIYLLVNILNNKSIKSQVQKLIMTFSILFKYKKKVFIEPEIFFWVITFIAWKMS